MVDIRVVRKSLNGSLHPRIKRGDRGLPYKDQWSLFKTCFILSIRELVLHASEMKRTGSIAMLLYLSQIVDNGEQLSTKIFEANYMKNFL